MKGSEGVPPTREASSPLLDRLFALAGMASIYYSLTEQIPEALFFAILCGGLYYASQPVQKFRK